MKDEYWATFPIYDHRTNLLRQAFVFFDYIVVPIPTSAYGGLTDKEIIDLGEDVALLKEEGVAKIPNISIFKRSNKTL